MLFSKTEYEEIMLPFKYVKDPNDPDETGIIDIEAYGSIMGQTKYCFGSFCLTKREMYENGDLEQMIELLKNSAGRTVKVIVKLKKGIAKDAKIDVNSLAEAYGDDRFKALELGGWSFGDISFEEKLRND